MSFGSLTVTVERSTTDRYNDATFAAHHTISGCLEYPNESTEIEQAVTDVRTLLCPSGSDIIPTDRIRLGGLIYQVDGLPKDWVDPYSGWAPGMQVKLRRVS